MSYARAHETFPHETTTDQWFTESQFESYRSLRFEIAKEILDRKDIPLPGETGMTLRQFLARLPETTRAAEAVGSLTPDLQPADAA